MKTSRHDSTLCSSSGETRLPFWVILSVQSIHLDATGGEIQSRRSSAVKGLYLEQNFKQHQLRRLRVEQHVEKPLIGCMKSLAKGLVHDFWMAPMAAAEA
jgi:hypothetical protein